MNPIETYFESLYPQLVLYCTKLLGNKEEAEDVSVDGFIKAVDKNKTANNLNDAKGLLFTYVKNQCVDIIRKRKLIHVHLKTISFDATEDEIDYDKIEVQIIEKMYTEIKNAPPLEKDVLSFHYIDGLKVLTIASLLNMNRRTIERIREKFVKRMIEFHKTLEP